MRVLASSTGAVQRFDYEPFGQTINAVGGSWRAGVGGYGDSDVKLRFTGKERDAETGLDDFGARYMSSAQGRFTSVDPIWVTKERMLDPQRLNLYAYGRNNPLKFIDPDGMDITLGRCATGNSSWCRA